MPKTINHTKSLLRHHFKLWLIISFVFSIGTLAPFCLEFVKIGFQNSLQNRLKTLLGSDLVISSRLALPIEKIDKERGENTQTVMVKSLYTMTKKATESNDQEKVKSRLANVTFIPEGFPYYGNLIAREKLAQFHRENIVYIWPELSELLDLKIGDQLKLGNKFFKIMGLIENDPGQVTQGQALAPKIYISAHQEKEIGLISKGSTVRYSYHFKFKNKIEQNKIEPILKEKFDKEGVNVRNSKENGEFISRTVNIINNFLGLGSFLSLLLSMLAITFVLNKMFKRETASLRNYHQMGISYLWVYQKYLKAFLSISILSSLLSSMLGYLIAPLISALLKEKFNIEIGSIDFIYVPGFILIAIFSLFFLYTPTALSFLKVEYKSVISKRPIWIGYLLIAIWVFSLAFYWTNSWKLLSIMTIGFLVLLFIIYLLGRVFFLFFERSIASERYPILKLSVLQLSRYRRHSIATIFLLTASIGVFGTINSIAEGLQYGLNYDVGNKRPSMFLFDIQPEQKKSLKALVGELDGQIRKLSPMVRARLIKIDGKKLEVDKDLLKTQEGERKERFLKRGVNLSYQNRLYDSEEIIKGTDFFGVSSDSLDNVNISIEEGYAKLLDINLGSTMTFEVLGIEFGGVVKNIRKINWQSFDPNFFIVVSEGMLNDAPQTLVSSIDLPDQRVSEFQNKLFDRLPNISSLDVRRVIGRIVNIISKVRGIFKIYGIFIIILGIVIIVGLLHLHWEDRSKDMNVLRIMGVQESIINQIMSIELSFIFALALIFSLLFQVIISKIILIRIFDVDPGQYGSIFETVLICVGIFLFLQVFYFFRSQQRSRYASPIIS